MIYIIADEERRTNAIEHIKLLDLIKPVEITIGLYKKNRSKSQNRLMWQYYAVIGDFMGMPSEDLHELMKVRVLGIDEKTVDRQLIRTPKSTTKLGTKEMADFLTAVEMLAVELGLALPVPDDAYYAMTGKTKEKK